MMKADQPGQKHCFLGIGLPPPSEILACCHFGKSFRHLLDKAESSDWAVKKPLMQSVLRTAAGQTHPDSQNCISAPVTLDLKPKELLPHPCRSCRR